MRINARLDDDHQRKLEFLMRATDLTVSGIIKQAIDLLYGRVREMEARSRDTLASSGFVGCGDGPKDLSATYKDQLDTSIRSKRGHR